MGKFIDTSYTKSVDNVSETVKSLLNNPYYMWTDKKPTTVTYYHINAERSTLDKAAKIPYSDLGPQCPFRFNKITKFVLYGIDRIALNLENGDFGVEAGEISGDAIVLPGTITPYPGDYFSIDLAKDSEWLFRVNDVDKDTLDDGSNIWKLSYRLEHIDNSKILDLVVDNYNLIVNNVGTRYNTVIKSDSYELIETIDAICVTLKDYFISLFYNEKVQTFIFVHYLEDHFYDPYMIEFLIRNKILEKGSNDEYIYIDHKIKTINTFALDYNRTFFKSIEDRDIKHLSKAKTDSTADYIDEFGSVFAARADDYFRMNYFVPDYDPKPQGYAFHNVMECFPKALIPKITNKDLYTKAEVAQNPMFGLHNIVIKYFNRMDYCKEDFEYMEAFEFSDSIYCFYMMPIIIFCLESIEKEILVKNVYDNTRLNK